MLMREDGATTTFAVETHGCKLNQADTLAISREFIQAGLTQVRENEAADIYVLNSCTVTHVADRKARQSLRSARRRNPYSTIVATGCYAERSPDTLRSMEEIDLVFGNVEKSRLVQQVLDWRDDEVVPCTKGDVDEFVSPRALRSRAMVKIQEGCDQVCAYCIVPKVRGRERSVPTEQLVDEIKKNIKLGYREVVLTGTQLGSYGFDLQESSLHSLISTILSETDIERLRVSSLQPKEITGDLLRLWDDKRLCPHFHMPLQSGSNVVLERMRRRYTAGEYVETVERIRDQVPLACVTADVIAGFPGETDSDFAATYELCERVGFGDLHVFPYSMRPGTSAAHFDEHIAVDVRNERMSELLTLSRVKADQFRRQSIGETHSVLWESQTIRGGEKWWGGLTANYLRVRTKCDDDLQNVISPAELLTIEDDGVVVAERVRDS